MFSCVKSCTVIYGVERRLYCCKNSRFTSVETIVGIFFFKLFLSPGKPSSTEVWRGTDETK